MAALKAAWEAADRLCSKRFHPFMPELAGILKKNGELAITEETEVPWYFFYQVSFLQEER